MAVLVCALRSLLRNNFLFTLTLTRTLFSPLRRPQLPQARRRGERVHAADHGV